MDRTITPDKLAAMLNNAAPLTLLDVRRQSDVAADPVALPGALWRDPDKVQEWAEELPRDRPLVVYCVRGGSVSNAVLDKLNDRGIIAQYIEGGLAAWKTSGNRIEKR